MKKIFYIIIILYTYTGFCQTQDSIIKQQVNDLLKKSSSYSKSNTDSALYFANEAVVLSKKYTDKILQTKALTYKAVPLFLKGKFKEADSILIQNFNRPIDTLTKGLNYINLGNSYNYQRKFEKAIDNYLKAIPIFEKTNNQHRLTQLHVNIGSLNAQLKQYDKAIKYLEKGIEYSKENEVLTLQIQANLSSLNIDIKNYSKSIEYALKAEKLAKKHNFDRGLSTIYSNLCMAYSDSKEYKNYDKAIEYGNLALDLKKKVGHTSYYSKTLNNLGHAYLAKKNYTKAIDYFEEALPLSVGESKSYVLNNLKQAYEKSGNTKTALKYSNEYIQLKDSLFTAKQEEKVAEIIEKYESDKKQQQIELQESRLENQRNILVGGGLAFLFLGLLWYFWYQNRKTKQELQQASLRQKLLQTQLNPHFLFHSLNSIQSYIYQNKTEESINYLSSYSKLMRSIFDTATEDFITVKQDTESIQEYLNLQKLQFNNAVNFSLKVEPGINEYKIPPMLVQPYVENAILHGIKNIENGKVLVTYSEENNQIKVVIFDNGKDFNSSKNNTNLHRTSSSEVIQQRLLNLKKIHNFDVKVTSSTKKTGTFVTLTFPKRN